MIKIEMPKKDRTVFTGDPREWPAGVYTPPGNPKDQAIITVSGDPLTKSTALWWYPSGSLLPTSVGYTSATFEKLPDDAKVQLTLHVSAKGA